MDPDSDDSSDEGINKNVQTTRNLKKQTVQGESIYNVSAGLSLKDIPLSVTDPNYNEELVSSYFPPYTKIETSMKRERLEVLNTFIKKLNPQNTKVRSLSVQNYEQYAYNTEAIIPGIKLFDL